MGQLKFDAKTGKLLPQKISYRVKHEEAIEEILEEYIKKGKEIEKVIKKNGLS